MRDDVISNIGIFLDAVREVAGEAGIEALHRDLGGRHLHVPCKRVPAASRFARALGMEAASAVAAKLRVIGADGYVLGGFQVYINRSGRDLPAAKRAAVARAYTFRAARAAQARAAAVEAVLCGMTRPQAARHCGVSLRTVYRALSERRARDASSVAGVTRAAGTMPSP